MIDWTRIQELRNEIGAEDFGEVVQLFLEEAEEEIAALRSGCDTSQIESRLHMLKGSALNLGFRSFAALCQTGETAAARRDFAQIDLPTILAGFDISRTQFIEGLAPPDR